MYKVFSILNDFSTILNDSFLTIKLYYSEIVKREQFFSRNRWQNSIKSVNGLSSSNGDQWWRVHKLKPRESSVFECSALEEPWGQLPLLERMNHGPWNRSREITHRKTLNIAALSIWDIHRFQKGKFHNWHMLDIRNSNFIYNFEMRIRT